MKFSKIEFSDGSEITFSQAAKMIENERQLGYGHYYKDGYRNTVAVLEKWYFSIEVGSLCREREIKNRDFVVCLDLENDKHSELSKKDLCKHMANYLRGWKRK